VKSEHADAKDELNLGDPTQSVDHGKAADEQAEQIPYVRSFEA